MVDVGLETDLVQGFLRGDFVSTLVGEWEQTYFQFNEGQQSLYLDYIEPAIYGWLASNLGDWPDVDVDDLVNTLYQAYDPEVMDRAFSDTIERPVPELQDLVEEAQLLELVEYIV